MLRRCLVLAAALSFSGCPECIAEGFEVSESWYTPAKEAEAWTDHRDARLAAVRCASPPCRRQERTLQSIRVDTLEVEQDMMTCDQILQRTVIDAGGVAIGDVEAVWMDPASWRVTALRVRLRREVTEQVGAARSLFRGASIDVPATAIRSVGDAILLNVGAAELRDASAPADHPAP